MGGKKKWIIFAYVVSWRFWAPSPWVFVQKTLANIYPWFVWLSVSFFLISGHKQIRILYDWTETKGGRRKNLFKGHHRVGSSSFDQFGSIEIYKSTILLLDKNTRPDNLRWFITMVETLWCDSFPPVDGKYISRSCPETEKIEKKFDLPIVVICLPMMSQYGIQRIL